MAYIKTNWQDQKVERPHTYESNTNADGTITLIDSFGNVEQMGTPVNAQNLNKIEDGLANVAIRLHNMTEVFAKDEWVKSGDKLYKSKQDQNKGHAVTEANWYSEVSLGGGMPVGTIFPHSASATFVPENSLPCDGTEYAQAQFKTLYNDWLVGKRLETCTYEQYQQEISATGECLKWALDTGRKTFKVPTKKNQIVSSVTASNKTPVKSGERHEFVNSITDKPITFADNPNSPRDDEFGFYNQRNNGLMPANVPVGKASSPLKFDNLYIDSSNIIKTKEIRYFVVVATGSIKQSEMDWSQWASSLQNKLDKDHANDTKPYLTETYVNGTSGYRVWSDGYCEQWGINKGSTTITLLKTYKDINYNIVGNVAKLRTYKMSFEIIDNTKFNTQQTVNNTSSGGNNAFFWQTKGYVK